MDLLELFILGNNTAGRATGHCLLNTYILYSLYILLSYSDSFPAVGYETDCLFIAQSSIAIVYHKSSKNSSLCSYYQLSSFIKKFCSVSYITYHNFACYHVGASQTLKIGFPGTYYNQQPNNPVINRNFRYVVCCRAAFF